MYEIYKINQDTTCILDKYKEALFLIKGNDKALLIDSGMDEDSLMDAITLITDKPVILALSHGHIDHIGLSNEFDDVYMNLKDLDTYKQHMTMKRGHFNCEMLHFKNPDDLLEMPDSFNLVNHEIKVIDLPGHTPGSVIFVDMKNKTIFTGDAIGSGCGVWLQLPESLSIKDYKLSLETNIKELKDLGVDDTWKFYGGHAHQEYESQVSEFNELNFQLMKDMVKLCDQLLKNNIEFYPTEAYAFNHTPYYVHYKKAEMIVTKEQLD